MSHAIMRTVMVDTFAGPVATEEVEPFVEPLGEHGGVRRVTEAPELVLDGPAQPRAEDDPAAGQRVKGGNLAGQLFGAATGDRGYQRAQAQPRGGQRGGRQQDPRVAEGLSPAPLLVVHDVVPHEQRIPAGGLGRRRELRYRASVGEVAEVRNVDRAPHGTVLPDRR